MARLSAALFASGALALSPALALADSAVGDTGSPSSVSPSPSEAAMQSVPAERRAGVVIGLAFGPAFAGASGYPNDSKLIGNPDYYSESPLLVGTSSSIFVMGALTDYLSFGPMVSSARMETEKWKSTGFGVGFRAEAFPFYRLVPRLADLAIYGMMGVGATELQAKGPYPGADGTQSFLGAGVHHEWRFFRMLGGHVSGGPYVEYDAIFSKPAERHWLSFGFRMAWYGGSVTADER
ncbi:MAG: hypothetical protein KF819_23660 [Labilithrix sp.]|nr:hypothetical protein [Labilithrix sp.]